MSHTGVIVRRNKNQMVPNAYWELALKANSKALGAAVVIDEGFQTSKLEEFDIELLAETQKTFMDKDITFYLGTSDAAIATDDHSPYIILERDGGDPAIIAFVTGNFPGFAKKESSHPPEFFYAHEFLIPKITQFAELSDFDLDKMFEQMGKPNFKKELLLHAVNYGYVSIMADNGKTLTFAQGDSQSEYPWGWVSHNYGYAIGPGAKTEEPARPKRGMFPSKSTVREKAPTAGTETATVPPKSATAVAAVKNFTVKKMAIPKGLSRSQKKGWVKSRAGYLVKGWNTDDFELEVYANSKGEAMTLEQVKKEGLAVAAMPKLNNPEPEKDIDNDYVSPDLLPVLSPKTREFLRDQFKREDIQKLVVDGAKTVFAPDKVQGVEAQLPDFAKQMNIENVNDYLCLPFGKVYEWNKEREDFLPNLFFDIRNRYIGLLLKMKKNEDKQVTIPPTSEGGTQTEKAPDVKPKRSMFPQKKVA